MPIVDDQILEKGANETVTFSIVFTNWLDSGESLSSVDSLTSDKADLTLSSGTISGTSVLFSASAGECGIYIITCTVTSSDSNVYEIAVKLRVR